MPSVTINYLAVLVAAISNMVLGFVWYGPLFGKEWMKMMHFTDKKMDEMKATGNMNQLYGIAMVGALVMAYVMAHFVDYVGATSVVGGMQTGFWAWLGFVAPVMLGGVLWEGRSWKLFTLQSGYYLVTLMIMGAILAVWV